MPEEPSDQLLTRAPAEYLDTPSPARMYDYFLGGDNNFEVDRRAADQVKAAIPNTYEIVWENRWFLHRLVRHLAEAGVTQFLDLGTGLPTAGNVHEIAAAITPDARVLYVDNDPLVLTHSRGLLTDTETTAVITADLRRPEEILGHPETRRLIDFDFPVAVLFVAVLHFIPDADNPARAVQTLLDAVPAGSYLALSHLTSDGPPADAVARTVEVYRGATSPIVFRPRNQIEAFFGSWDLVDPGLVRAHQWRPVPDHDARTGWLYAGVARKTGH